MSSLEKELGVFANSLTKPYRSITGNGVRETLRMIGEHIPLTMHEVPSGTKVFDWTIPDEWNIHDAYVMDERGSKIIDFTKSYLHVVGYSPPINTTVSKEELEQHLYSLPTQPNAIPYVTSYYKPHWGFCVSDEMRRKIRPGSYRVRIDSTLKKGSLSYGEAVIKGATDQEILLSAYVCHPTMANDNISGIVLGTFLGKWLQEVHRKYTYRIVFVPETIGSLAYLSSNLKHMKKHTVAGFILTCMGDERTFSYLPSRSGTTLADRVALNTLKHLHPEFIRYTYLDRGSDERQYCSPGADLPVATIMRSKYGMYPEYHTSLDNFSLVTEKGLAESFETLKTCIEVLEKNDTYQTVSVGEPQLGKRGLYETVSLKGSFGDRQFMSDFIGFADGSQDVLSIAEAINAPAYALLPIIESLEQAGAIRKVIPVDLSPIRKKR